MRAQEVRRHGSIIVKNPMRCQEHRHGFLSGCISILVVYQFFPFSARGYRLCLSFSRSRRRRPQAAAATVCRSSTSPTPSATAGGCCAASCRAGRRAACSVSPTAATVLCRSCPCSAAPSSASAMRTASAACSRTLREARGRIVFPFSRGSARCSRRADGGSMRQSALPYPRRACSSAPRSPAGRCVNGSPDAAARYGTQRIALDCQRLAMDFVLPCRSGEGTPLTPEELASLRERCGAAVFFFRGAVRELFQLHRAGPGAFCSLRHRRNAAMQAPART